MSEGPKLFTHKPKKEQVKKFVEQQKGKDFSEPSSASAMGSQSSTPPPQPPKESFARRYKFVWPILLTVNLAIGAYLFMRTKKKDTDIEVEVSAPISTKAATSPHIAEKPIAAPPIAELVKTHKPIPEDQQRELFKWILEEKRKVKTKDPQEKKRIDEEKAILKQFIQGKSVPSI
ncbi:WAS/WASL-interacting family protein [Quillaja saponaria]|uniref:WAS/WASL-interacting family protein n=1 Tax=Quillaja saponaria TaxID=32244 RepID=A0AAD7L5D1_QUISA|nr:WAS/WASL-interacting family protein [Quillaja saponaria]